MTALYEGCIRNEQRQKSHTLPQRKDLKLFISLEDQEAFKIHKSHYIPFPQKRPHYTERSPYNTCSDAETRRHAQCPKFILNNAS